jgi:hypothetical protein
MCPHRLALRFQRPEIALVVVHPLELKNVETSSVLPSTEMDCVGTSAASLKGHGKAGAAKVVVGSCSAAVAVVAAEEGQGRGWDVVEWVGAFAVEAGWELLDRLAAEEDRRNLRAVEGNAVHSFAGRSLVKIVEEVDTLRGWSVERSP